MQAHMPTYTTTYVCHVWYIYACIYASIHGNICVSCVWHIYDSYIKCFNFIYVTYRGHIC